MPEALVVHPDPAVVMRGATSCPAGTLAESTLPRKLCGPPLANVQLAKSVSVVSSRRDNTGLVVHPAAVVTAKHWILTISIVVSWVREAAVRAADVVELTELKLQVMMGLVMLSTPAPLE